MAYFRVGNTAAGPHQHSQSWFRVPIFLFFPRLLSDLKWGSLFDERLWLLLVTPPLPGVTRAGTHSHFPPTFLSLYIEYLLRRGPHRKQRNSSIVACIRWRGNVYQATALQRPSFRAQLFRLAEGRGPHRQQGDLICLLLFFLSKVSRLKICEMKLLSFKRGPETGCAVGPGLDSQQRLFPLRQCLYRLWSSLSHIQLIPSVN
jgi:hypothetical protein